MKILTISLLFTLFLAGCETPQTQTQLVSVVSSKPYRYITFSKQDTPATVAQIVRHNRAHAAVIAAEKRAKARNVSQ
jgi:hypothetical protein